MKKLFFPVLCSLLVFQYSNAQMTLSKAWDYRYGGTENDKLETFQQTSDGGFIMGGNSMSGMSGDKTEASRGNLDYWVVKVDPNGIKQWDKRFGGSLMDELHSLQQTSDGGYILGGSSRSGASGDRTQPNWDQSANPSPDFWIVKIDASGNKQWDKRFGGIWADDLYCVKQTIDGGYILGGFSISNATGDKTQPAWGAGPDFWVVKIDASGTKMWDKRYGGDKNDQLFSLAQTHDGGYLFGGFSWSNISGEKTQNNHNTINYCDYWVVKTDVNGNQQWDKCYGSDLNDQLDVLIATKDGGYVLAGYSWSAAGGDKTVGNFGPDYTPDYWVLKLDPFGNKKWDRTIGGIDRENDFGMLNETRDNGFLISGSSYSNISGWKSEDNMGIEQSWVVKLDSLGDKAWDKTIFTTGHDEACMAIELLDGSYVVANYTNGSTGGYKTQDNRDATNNTYDYWIVKFLDTSSMPNAAYTSTTHAFCPEHCVDFINQTTYATSYQWIFQGGSPPSSNDIDPQNICYGMPGSYDVTLIATNTFGSDTLTMQDYVTVYAGPMPFTLRQSGDTLFAPVGMATYQWYLANSMIPGANSHFIVTSQSGIYGVTVNDGNGCQASSSMLIVYTGISKLNSGSTDLRVFPNPVENMFTATLSTPVAGTWNLDLFNSVGQAVYSQKIDALAGETKLMMESHQLAEGIYFLKVTNGEKSIVKRVDVKR